MLIRIRHVLSTGLLKSFNWKMILVELEVKNGIFLIARKCYIYLHITAVLELTAEKVYYFLTTNRAAMVHQVKIQPTSGTSNHE